MDVLPASAVVRAAPKPSGHPAALFRLGLAATGVFASLAGAGALATLLVERSSPYSAFAPFDGWQVNLAAAVLAAAVLAVAVLSLRSARRVDRDRRLRSPSRLIVVVAVLVPGLGLGALSGVPMTSALSWASDRTAAAAANRAWLTSYQKAPLPTPSDEPVAPKAIADRLLHTSDLGAGWYDVVQPNQTTQRVTVVRARQGITGVAHSALSKDHRSGAVWVLDELLVENMDTFSSPAQAQEFARAAGQITTGECGCLVPALPTTSEQIDGVTVWKQTNSTSSQPAFEAAFVQGRDVFVLTLTVQAKDISIADESRAVMESAVHRASQEPAKRTGG